MSISRRTFLGQVAAGTLLSTVTGRAAEHRIERLGVQLYTVRDLMAKDFDGTLAKVASLGYQEVEFAGYFDQTPKNVRAILDRNKLTAPSAHVDYPSLGEKLPRVIEASQKSGIQFAYHNHHFEFVPVNGAMPYDLLLKECDPDLVKMELDLCWITVAGQDPLTYFGRYPGRFPLVHAKGLKKLPTGPAPVPFDQAIPNITDVGSSDIIDWKRIFAHSEQAGIRNYFVGHDQPASPLDSLRASAR